MNTTTTRRLTTIVALAVAGFALATTAPAGAIPDDRGFDAPGFTVPDTEPLPRPPFEPGTSPCFLERAGWNNALDGPPPAC